MAPTILHAAIRRAMKKIANLLVRRPPDDPDDPYALVTAPTKPRPPHLIARARAVPENYRSD